MKSDLARSLTVRFDHRGRASLDGEWDFYPMDLAHDELDSTQPERIRVPALWEAQGYLELDGAAWYRRRFRLEEAPSFATLRFGAVMDIADVYLNGTHLGTHELPFTPFSFDVHEVLREGENELAVRVVDPSIDDPEHVRSPHGKQGWANWVFPSRPSLYMTYGGIWQPVELRSHGSLVIEDVFVHPDPDDVAIEVELRNVSRAAARGRVSVRALGVVYETEVEVAPSATQTVRAAIGRTNAPWWTPDDPVLHDALVDVITGGRPSDMTTVRFGLRTVTLDGARLLINGVPYRMKSVLVQGFRADGLYDEGPRDEIEREVRAAREMGFNTLRLHIKAFDPRYLDICDELGMLLHCDIPVAEPIAHEEMGADTAMTKRCIAAARAQVRRDRNHPSIILWSAMNELCWDRQEARHWDVYEEFVHAIAGEVMRLDPTRPVIENDWPEPDPDRVFLSPILTAHWYGRLHADYLEKIERSCVEWRDTGKPLYVTEFGDWGLPEMPRLTDVPFWDTRELYAAGLASTLWPATVERFVRETQRYQGLSDRLQIEVYRRHDHIGGYCLTELTDVPHELNGVLDLHRDPKPLAVREIVRANQTVLPMLRLDSLVLEAGSIVRTGAWIANDGDALDGVTVEVRFGDAPAPIEVQRLLQMEAASLPLEHLTSRFDEESWAVAVGSIPGYRPVSIGEAVLAAPEVTGAHDLIVRLRSGGVLVAENRYPIHVVARPHALGVVRVIDDDETAAALASLGAVVGTEGPLVVGEGRFTARSEAAARDTVANGGTVVILAQPPVAAERYPMPVRIAPVETAWGSSVFHFTTDQGALTSLPRLNVLVAEDSTIQAVAAVVEVEGNAFPTEPLVIAYKPTPGAMTGTIVGEHRVGEGRVVMCQYRLVGRTLGGDAAARALLGDLVRHAREPDRGITAERLMKEDGRSLTLYSFEEPA